MVFVAEREAVVVGAEMGTVGVQAAGGGAEATLGQGQTLNPKP